MDHVLEEIEGGSRRAIATCLTEMLSFIKFAEIRVIGPGIKFMKNVIRGIRVDTHKATIDTLIVIESMLGKKAAQLARFTAGAARMMRPRTGIAALSHTNSLDFRI